MATGAHTFKNIVVALDGSKEAEAIWPYVESIARAFNARLTFVCALVPVEDTVPGEFALTEASLAPEVLESVYETHDLVGEKDASYLARVKKRWSDLGFDVASEEPPLRAAQAIVEIAREKRADLIAMTTHGRRGMSRAVLGSVADEVVRTAPCSVLLVRQ